MESQDNQSPVKVNFFNRLRGAIKKNKDDSLEEFPLSVRFIIKYIAFTMHQAHKPTKDYNLILAVKDKELNLLIPLHYLDFLHKVILVFLLVYFARLMYDAIKKGLKRAINTIKDIRH